MKNVRSIPVHQHAGGINFIVRITPDMRTAVDNKYALVEASRKSLCQHGPCKAGAYD